MNFSRQALPFRFIGIVRDSDGRLLQDHIEEKWTESAKNAAEFDSEASANDDIEATGLQGCSIAVIARDGTGDNWEVIE